MPGTITSPVEVVQLTPHGIWLAYGDDEYFLDHDLFPWFRHASVDKVFNIEEVSSGHFYWPDLDIDIELEALRHPERFPLIYRR